VKFYFGYFFRNEENFRTAAGTAAVIPAMTRYSIFPSAESSYTRFASGRSWAPTIPTPRNRQDCHSFGDKRGKGQIDSNVGGFPASIAWIRIHCNPSRGLYEGHVIHCANCRAATAFTSLWRCYFRRRLRKNKQCTPVKL